MRLQGQHGGDVVHEMQLAHMFEEVIPAAPSRRHLMRHRATSFVFLRGGQSALKRVLKKQREEERRGEKQRKETRNIEKR